ncbi:hypothetical protein HGRIS_006585 [Hohenbuehelia grisea]|uniref:Uncharacterized protein n=2 Tax=Hohenbuehelia grisea TaxID=104357 RepID=A0ABR3J9R8_9AGAR
MSPLRIQMRLRRILRGHNSPVLFIPTQRLVAVLSFAFNDLNRLHTLLSNNNGQRTTFRNSSLPRGKTRGPNCQFLTSPVRHCKIHQVLCQVHASSFHMKTEECNVCKGERLAKIRAEEEIERQKNEAARKEKKEAEEAAKAEAKAKAKAERAKANARARAAKEREKAREKAKKAEAKAA